MVKLIRIGLFMKVWLLGEPLKQKAYLNQMAGLMEQGPSRGGTASGQFIMNQMDIAHRKGQKEKIEKEEEIKKKIADEKKKAEEEAAFLDSPKGRLQTLWNDADKRDAILGGIADSMTEVKFGARRIPKQIS